VFLFNKKNIESMRLKLLLPVLIASVFCSCNNQGKTNESGSISEAKTPKKKILAIAGQYATSDYLKRNEGYDWVGVSVTLTNDSTAIISVRSRADKKKPTCTFDAIATRINETTYVALAEGKPVLFIFSDSAVTISAKLKEDEGILHYYCSGGGSLADTYQKIYESLDEKQIDPTVFSKTLSLQNVGFNITTTGKGSHQQLMVQPFGLKVRNDKVVTEIDGYVTNAEIEDLNSDGFPEVLIYTSSASSGNYGNVIGYSVNKGKSMSSISFPAITDNPKASEGYMGHDEFAIVETNLVQRFRIYKKGDSNNHPTGNYRQIQYKMVNGEASRKFVIEKIVEFPAN
jgi:hypothetical protein